MANTGKHSSTEPAAGADHASSFKGPVRFTRNRPRPAGYPTVTGRRMRDAGRRWSVRAAALLLAVAAVFATVEQALAQADSPFHYYPSGLRLSVAAGADGNSYGFRLTWTLSRSGEGPLAHWIITRRLAQGEDEVIFDNGQDGVRTRILTGSYFDSDFPRWITSAGMAVTYRIRVYNSTGRSVISDRSPTLHFEFLPEAPADFEVRPATGSGIALSWTIPTGDATGGRGLTGFEIERRANNGPYEALATVPATASTYQDTTAQPGNTYTYQVRGANTRTQLVPRHRGAASRKSIAFGYEERPGAPEISATLVFLSGWYRISWSPTTPAATSYELFRRAGDGPFQLQATVPPSGDDTLRNDLREPIPGVQYTWYVDAVNANGRTRSQPVTYGSPPAPALTVTGGTRELRLSWTQRLGGIPIHGWNIRYQRLDSTADPVELTVGNGLTRGWNISHQDSETPLPAGTYEVRLRADVNEEQIAGAWALGIAMVRDRTIPEPEADLTPPQSISVQLIENVGYSVEWEPATVTGPTGQYTYEVFRREREGAFALQESVAPSDSLASQLTRTEPGVPYAWYIITKSSDGRQSRPSPVVHFGSPPAPSAVRITPGDRSLHLRWPDVSDFGAPIRHWRLEYNEVGQSFTTVTLNVSPADSHEHTLTGLKANGQYVLRLAAVNDAGIGQVYFSPAVRVQAPTRTRFRVPSFPDQILTRGTAVDIPLPTATSDSGLVIYELLGTTPGLQLDRTAQALRGTPTEVGTNWHSWQARDNTDHQDYAEPNPNSYYRVRPRAPSEPSDYASLSFYVTVMPPPAAPRITVRGPDGLVHGLFVLEVEASEVVTGLELTDFTVVNGSATALVGGGRQFTATISPTMAGPVTIAVQADAVRSASDMPNAASNTIRIVYAGEQAVPTAPPGAPSAFTVTARGTDSIELSWTAPSDATGDTTYAVDRSPNGMTGWEILAVGLAGTTYTDRGLQPGHTWHYRVSGANSAGHGPRTIARSATTFTRTSAPTALTATAVSATEIRLTWQAPTNTGYTSITSYRVERSSDGFTRWTLLAENLNGTSYAHTGLTAGTRVHYRVRAINAVGASDASATARGTTHARPGAPRNLMTAAVTETTLTLSWSPPATDGGAPVLGYRIDRAVGEAGNWSVVVSDTSSTNSRHPDTGLTADTVYMYRVAAINTVDTGAPSTPVSVRTASRPTVPRGLAATITSPTQVELSWGPPESSGSSAITVYRIEQSADGTTGWQSVAADIGPTAFRYEHTVTDTATPIHYQVGASSAVGDGPFSAAVVTAVANPPGPPTALNAVVAGTGSITLSWTAPTATGGSAVAGYRVEQAVGDSGDWVTVADRHAASPYTATALTAGLLHRYRVAAINTTGSGPYTDIATATTHSVPGPPQQVAAAASSGSAITVTWSPPASTGGQPLTAFGVEHSTDGGAHWTSLSSSLSARATRYIHRQLASGTTVEYRVFAINASGQGESSPAVGATTFRLPGAPEQLAVAAQTTGAITVTWMPPASDGGAPIIGYRLEHSSTGESSSWTALATLHVSTTEYTHSPLTAGTVVHYRVAATNAVGAGAFSNALTATSIAAPGVPLAVMADGISPNAINLRWQLPTTDGGSPVQYYRIERTADSTGATGWAELMDRPTGTDWSDTSLPVGTTFRYRVAAVNAVGAGDNTPSVSATTFGSPTAPIQVTATIVAAGTVITVSWGAPTDDGGSTITEYRVERSPTGTGDWTPLPADDPADDLVYTNVGSPLPTGDLHYRVLAVNGAGVSPHSPATLAVAANPPGAPTALTTTISSPGEVTLGWTEPTVDGRESITSYRIERRTEPETMWTIIVPSHSASMTSYIDTSLSVGVEYSYRVSATNARGTGPPSVPVTQLLAAVPDAPTGLAADTTSPPNVVLTWTAPAAGGAAITGYQVQRSADGMTNWATVAANHPAAPLTVTDQEVGVTWHYWVAAHNAVGLGAYSTTVSAKIIAPPSPPDSITAEPANDTQIDVTWTAPRETGGSEVIRYTVERSATGSDGWQVLATVDANATLMYAHTGLTAGEFHYYRVRATNAAGNSEYAVAEPTAIVDRPGQPQDLTLVEYEYPGITLSWSAPQDAGGARELSYRVERITWTGSRRGLFWELVAGAHGGTEFVDTEVREKNQFIYRVYALNDAGPSLPSAELPMPDSVPTAQTLPQAAFVPVAPLTAYVGATLGFRVFMVGILGAEADFSFADSTPEGLEFGSTSGSQFRGNEWIGVLWTPTAVQTGSHIITVVGSTAAREAQLSVDVTVLDVPTSAVITNVEVTPGPDYLRVQFDAGITDQVTIHARDEGSRALVATYELNVTSGESYDVVIDELSSQTNYQVDFEVGDGNKYDGLLSDANRMPSFTGHRTTAISAPAGLSVVGGDREMLLSWRPPTDFDARLVTGYRIEVSETGMDDSWVTLVRDTGAPVTTFTHVDLGDDWERHYRVRAITDAGLSQWTAARNGFTYIVDLSPLSFEGQTIPAQNWTNAASGIPALHLPQAYGGTAPLTYSLSPTLPTGLTRDRFRVYGSTQQLQAATTYTWRVQDSATMPVVRELTFTIAITATNQPPQVVNRYARIPLRIGLTRTVDARPLFRDDGDVEQLSYSASSADSSIATVAVVGTNFVFNGIQPGETAITLTATDASGLSTNHSYETYVGKPLRLVAADGGMLEPVHLTAGVFAEETLLTPVDGSGASINLIARLRPPLSQASGCFLQPNLAAPDIGRAISADGEPCAANTGTYRLTVFEAWTNVLGIHSGFLDEDYEVFSASTDIEFVVVERDANTNQPPQVRAGTAVPDLVVLVGESVFRDMTPYFTDPDANDGPLLRYTPVSAHPAIATAIGSGSQIQVFGVAQGTTTLTVHAKDGLVNSAASQTINLEVKAPVVVTGALIPDLLDGRTGAIHSVGLQTYLIDSDRAMTFVTSTSNASIATAAAMGDTLNVTGVAEGTALISVEGRLNGRLYWSDRFSVTFVTERTVALTQTAHPNPVRWERMEAVQFELPEFQPGRTGNPPLTYSVRPSLPRGLSADPQTHTITGTASEPVARKIYQLEIRDSDGDTFAYTLDAEVTPRPAPQLILQRGATHNETNLHELFIWPMGESLTYTVTNENGAVASASLMAPDSLAIAARTVGAARIRVRAAVDDDRDAASRYQGESQTVVLRADVMPPPIIAAPTLTGITRTESDDVRLTWTAPTTDPSASLSGYELRRSRNGVEGWRLLPESTMLAVTATEVTVAESEADRAVTTYYRLVAVGSTGPSEPSNALELPAANLTTGITLVNNTTELVEAEATVQIGIVATLNGETTFDSALQIPVTIGGTATSGTDYTTDSDVFTLELAANAMSTTASVSLMLRDDDIVEPTELITFAGGEVAGAAHLTVEQTEMMILDDDTATVSIANPARASAEGTDLIFTVQLSAPVADMVTITWSSSAGTASAPQDFTTQSNQTLSIPTGTEQVEITVPTRNDRTSEGDETLNVTINTVTSVFAERVTLDGTASTAVGTIAASDPITLSLDGPYNVREGDETRPYTVSATGGIASAPIIISYTVTSTTATASDDYTVPAGSVTIGTGQTSATFTIQTTPDDIADADETLVVTLSANPTGGGGATGLSANNFEITTTIREGVTTFRPAAPTAFTATGRASHVALAWQPPSDDGGATITAYAIEHGATEIGPWISLAANLPNTARAHVHTDLEVSETVHYRLIATNAVGTSLPAATANATTAAVALAAPAAPTALTAVGGPQLITLSWAAPAAAAETLVDRYQLESSEDGAEPWTVVAGDIAASATSYRHENLRSALTLHYQIRAGNSAGLSPPSDATSASTDLSVLALPAVTSNADANGDGTLNEFDVRVLYYAAALGPILGDGTGGGFADLRSILLRPLLAVGTTASDVEYNNLLRRATTLLRAGPTSGFDLNRDLQVNESDALILYYSMALTQLVGTGESGTGEATFRRTFLGAHMPPGDRDDDERLRAVLRGTALFRQAFGELFTTPTGP